MERIPNPELERVVLNHLAELYNIKEKREGIHLSTLVGCLTRSFFDQVSPIEPTDKEVLLFVVGYGLQDVLTPQEAETPLLECEGITYRPDFMLRIGEQELGEIKTTRMGVKRMVEGLPETWLEYMMGGCHIRGVTSYNLAVLLIVPPDIIAETLLFDQAEIDDNWLYLMARKEVYEDAIAANQPPAPYYHCKGFECGGCRYKLVCDNIGRQGGEPNERAS